MSKLRSKRADDVESSAASASVSPAAAAPPSTAAAGGGGIGGGGRLHCTPRFLLALGLLMTSLTGLMLIRSVGVTPPSDAEMAISSGSGPVSSSGANRYAISESVAKKAEDIKPVEAVDIFTVTPPLAADSPLAPRTSAAASPSLPHGASSSTAASSSSSKFQNTQVSADLPGASEHPILRLDDKSLVQSTVAELMSGYAAAEGGRHCEADFGNALVRKWRETKKSYCDKKSSQLGSSIDCYLIHQNNHAGNGDNLCVMHNVAVDLSVYGNDAFTEDVIRKYVSTNHMAQPYPKFHPGFIVGDCSPKPDVWKSSFMPGWNSDLTVGAYKHISQVEGSVECSTWIDHTVLLQERDTFANFFHDSEDFVNAFLAMAILELKPRGTQLFLMDLYPEGPFWDMWKDVFSHGFPVLTGWDLKTHFGAKSNGKKTNYVCFRELAVGIYGPAAPTTLCNRDTPCKKTALVRAYSDFVIRSFNLQQFSHYASPEPKREVVVTYLTRRPTSEWPEKKYCNDTHSFFKCQYWANHGPRQLGRMVRNDDALIDGLKQLQGQSFSNGASVKVVAADYNALSLKEQIASDIQTDIMIGPHGAGLMHNIFMRDRASLIELFIDGSSGNRHFHNLASWYGRRYQGVQMSNPVDVAAIVQLVREHIEAIGITSY